MTNETVPHENGVADQAAIAALTAAEQQTLVVFEFFRGDKFSLLTYFFCPRTESLDGLLDLLRRELIRLIPIAYEKHEL